MMNWLKKVNAIDTSELVNKTDYNAKFKNIEVKMLTITNLTTTTTLNSVENKIADVSTLIRKADYADKIKQIENKLFIIIGLQIINLMQR